MDGAGRDGVALGVGLEACRQWFVELGTAISNWQLGDVRLRNARLCRAQSAG